MSVNGGYGIINIYFESYMKPALWKKSILKHKYSKFKCYKNDV